jgi:hypothetical protein
MVADGGAGLLEGDSGCGDHGIAGREFVMLCSDIVLGSGGLSSGLFGSVSLSVGWYI